MEERNNLPQLPKGWAWTTIEEILQAMESGGRPKGGAKGITQGVPSIGGEHLLYKGSFDFSQTRYVPEEYYEKMTRGKIAKNDVLVVKDGATTGKTSFVSEDFPFGRAAVNEHVFILRVFRDLTNPKYLYFWMQSPFGQRCVGDNFQGTAQGGITSSFTKNSHFPLPPLPEQHRIVAKIEELFSDLDADVAALKKAQAQLKRYRQAVLKAAVEGTLTAEWRAANAGTIEPASALLERIRAERATLGAVPRARPARGVNGGMGGDHKGAPLRVSDAAGLGELPEGWWWARVREISAMIQYGTSEKANEDSSGFPVVRMGNIQEGGISFEALKYLPSDSPHLSEFILEDGDVLFNRTNSAELVGKTAVYKRRHPTAVFASYLIRVKVDKDAYHPDMLSFFINSFHGRRYIGSVVSQQVGQANVNGTKLAQMPIPLPPLAEQQQIVAEVERRLSVADEVERTVDASLKQAERLRQSILKRAFAGKLVPQDPNDEPAERLVERIRAARDLTGITKSVRSGKHRATQSQRKKSR